MEDKKEESEHYESDNSEDADARVGVSNYYHCPICFESIGQENTTTTICHHKFHCSCLIEHIAKNNLNCPICRTTLFAGAVGIGVSGNYFEHSHSLTSLGPTSYHSETSIYYGNVYGGVGSNISANRYNQFNMNSGPTGGFYVGYSSSQLNNNAGPTGGNQLNNNAGPTGASSLQTTLPVLDNVVHTYLESLNSSGTTVTNISHPESTYIFRYVVPSVKNSGIPENTNNDYDVVPEVNSSCFYGASRFIDCFRRNPA